MSAWIGAGSSASAAHVLQSFAWPTKAEVFFFITSERAQHVSDLRAQGALWGLLTEASGAEVHRDGRTAPLQELPCACGGALG